MFNLCYGETSIIITDYVVSYLRTVSIYNGIQYLIEKIMNSDNRHSSRIKVALKYNNDFDIPEPAYVYSGVIKLNLFGDSNVWRLSTHRYPSKTRCQRFKYPLCRPIEQSFIESMTVRLVTKNGEDMLFEDSEIPCVVTLYFKK